MVSVSLVLRGAGTLWPAGCLCACASGPHTHHHRTLGPPVLLGWGDQAEQVGGRHPATMLCSYRQQPCCCRAMPTATTGGRSSRLAAAGRPLLLSQGAGASLHLCTTPPPSPPVRQGAPPDGHATPFGCWHTHHTHTPSSSPAMQWPTAAHTAVPVPPLLGVATPAMYCSASRESLRAPLLQCNPLHTA